MSRKYEIEAIGQVLERGAQKFECVAVVPTTRKDGTATRYAVMRSQCADCGADFEFTCAMSGRAFQPNRRCSKHKAPWRTVGAPRPKDLLAEIRMEVKRLQYEKAAVAKQLAYAQNELLSVGKRLAAYELTDEEGQRFAALCAQKAKERRAHLERAKARSGSVFD